MPISKEGFIFIIPLFILSVLFLFVGIKILGIISGIMCVFCLYFFRDPVRNIAGDDLSVIAPADGKIIDIEESESGKTVKIFMSVFNVHVQRSPVAGLIQSTEYKKGKFINAIESSASMENEQNIIKISSYDGNYHVKQIAGLIARRIVCYVKPGEKVMRGDKIGFIKFGSQVNVTVPNNVNLIVKKGDSVIGGQSIIGLMREVF